MLEVAVASIMDAALSSLHLSLLPKDNLSRSWLVSKESSEKLTTSRVEVAVAPSWSRAQTSHLLLLGAVVARETLARLEIKMAFSHSTTASSAADPLAYILAQEEASRSTGTHTLTCVTPTRTHRMEDHS